MEDVHQPSSSSLSSPCNRFISDNAEKKPLKKFPLLRRRASKPAGFSLSVEDFEVINMEVKVVEEEDEEEEEEDDDEEEEEEEEEEGIINSTPREVVDEDDSIRSLGSETDSSKASSSDDSDTRPNSKSSSPPQWHSFFKLLKKKRSVTKNAINNLHAFPNLSVVPKLTRLKSKRLRAHDMVQLPSFDADLCYFKSSWKNFTLSDLQAATNNFALENVIGEGGYSEVYKGQVSDGQFVAIKRLTGGTPEEMTSDFLSELGIIVHVNHPNIAKLIGYGVEGGMHLVLQLSPHGSLASLLSGTKKELSWDVRYKIALGTAKGLLYLHEGCPRRIIHKDIKAANILLTEDFEPQISDFGLAKWLPEQWTHHVVSKFEGTFGYLPPEFFMHGIVDEKTDVYAYGVLLLELITGRLALDNSQQSLMMWAKPLLAKNCINELVDPCIANVYDSEQMNLVVLMASLCVDQSSIQRPEMSQVVKILSGEEGSLELIQQFRKPVLQRTYSEELLDADEYNSTKYLNDMNRQMQITLEPQ